MSNNDDAAKPAKAMGEGFEYCHPDRCQERRNWMVGKVGIGCGCGKPHSAIDSNSPIHWRNAHWRLECAFRESLRDLSLAQHTIGQQRMNNKALRDHIAGLKPALPSDEAKGKK